MRKLNNLMLSQLYNVSYGSSEYKGDKQDYKGLFYRTGWTAGNNVHVESVPAIIDFIPYLSEDENKVSLEIKNIIYDNENGESLFYEEYIEPITLNKETNVITGDYHYLEEYIDARLLTEENSIILGTFIKTIMDYKYPYFAKILDDIVREDIGGNTNVRKNICYLVFEGAEAIEKIYSITPKVVIQNLIKEDFVTNLNLEEGKLNQVVGMPASVMHFIGKHKQENSFVNLQELSKYIDGNDYQTLISYLESAIISDRNLIGSYKVNNFIANLLTLIRDYDYNLNNLLSLLIKESLMNTVTPKFFADEEIGLLVDYHEISEQNGLTHEKYPSFIRKRHNIAQKNIMVLSRVNEEEFIEKVDSYKFIEKEFNKMEQEKINNIEGYEQKYILKAPSNIEDMVEEGNQLHHCVANYTTKVINDESIVLFLREIDNEEESFITVELNTDYQLGHARGIYNSLPEDDVNDLINDLIYRLVRL